MTMSYSTKRLLIVARVTLQSFAALQSRTVSNRDPCFHDHLPGFTSLHSRYHSSGAYFR
jgi:hypothetical protein